jgi:hypothetical protein
VNEPADDQALANALARADALHPPAPGSDWSAASLHAAVRHRRQRRLLGAGLAVTLLVLLVVLLQTPRAAAAPTADTVALQAELQAMQAELQALRARLGPVAATPRPEPTDHDRTAVRLELARAGAEACRPFPAKKEIR